MVIIEAFAMLSIILFLGFIDLKKRSKVCPKCGQKMQIKKKYRTRNKGRFIGKYWLGSIKETILVPYCENCGYENFPPGTKDIDSWKDASEL